jgi:hypothetical protein
MPTAACEDLEARTSEYCVQSFYSRIKNLMGGITTVRENTLILQMAVPRFALICNVYNESGSLNYSV